MSVPSGRSFSAPGRARRSMRRSPDEKARELDRVHDRALPNMSASTRSYRDRSGLNATK